ncbi:hypothetical protein QBC32DRAFT_336926 [Pseudoneurospora amorphoporcata]|uniref:Uncharacterized protein n=1 Tax=Pseudoneurospora amorphoporcata TaxID=241081 RepID=A0AAN6SIH9_9PEZI|nr:hypothetical protein QBC32DRAFT_336926 [Pseudoneurospora amorphoporcata]
MAASSPLTDIDGTSTPASFHTAANSPNTADTTNITSPDHEDDRKPKYYKSEEIPHVLKQSCQIHLEEQMYLPAIELLGSLLSDAGERQQTDKPVRVPPPAQIALLGTLTIHPAYTSRAPEQANLDIAAESREYLRTLLNKVGPVNADFRSAFSFRQGQNSGRWARRGSREFNSAGESDGGGDIGSFSEADNIESKWSGNDHSIWRRSSDFWSVLGWAFRCSTTHPHRWVHWKAWLDFMIECLEKDWDERLAQDEANFRTELSNGNSSGPESEATCQYPLLQQSLLVQYVNDLRRDRKRVLHEVIRALFAFADDENTADNTYYKEVFNKETVLHKDKNKKRKHSQMAAVDLEKDQFGDYLEDWDDPVTDDDEKADTFTTPHLSSVRIGRRTKARPKSTPFSRPGKAFDVSPTTSPSPLRVTDGLADSIPLRLRLFRLVSGCAFYLPPDILSCKTQDLYDLFTSRLKSLPLPCFELFLSLDHDGKVLPRFIYVSLLRYVAQSFTPRSAPKPEDVDPEADAEHAISQAMLRECFLPFSAKTVTVEDNAKFSLVLESMAWCLFQSGSVDYFEGLKWAVEKGIEEREKKIKKGSAKGGAAMTAAEKMGRQVLERSAASLRAFVDAVEATSFMEDGDAMDEDSILVSSP